MKIKRILTLILLCTLTIKINTTIPLNEIQGLASICNPTIAEGIDPNIQKINGNKFSPIWGALLWNSPYIENLWRYGDNSSATIRLVKELFFLHHDEITFDVTYLPLKIGAHLSLENIGQIIGYIDNFHSKINTKTKNNAFIESEKKSLSLQLDSLIEQIENQNKELIKNKIKKYFEDSINKTRKEIALLAEQVNNHVDSKASEEKIKKLTPKIEGWQKNLTKENSEHSKIISQNFLESKTVLRESLVKSLLENIYLPDNTISILLAFAWAKAKDKDDLINLFWGIYSTLNDKQKLFREDVFNMLKNQPNLIKESFTTTMQPYINQPLFNKSDYKTSKDISCENIKKQIAYNLEDLSITIFGVNLYDESLPKAINMVGSAIYQETSFPDCGETSLLNLFIAILYNPENNGWNFDILENIGADPKLNTFFSKYSPQRIHLKAAHDDWANIVSNIPGVKYLRINCEIDPYNGISNMLIILGNLIPGIKTFEDLKNKLKTAEIDIEFISSNDINLCPNDNAIEIQITKSDGRDFTIYWIFLPEHFEMIFPLLESIPHFKEYRETLKNIPTPNDYEKNKKTIFLSLYQMPFSEISTLGLEQRLERSFLLMKDMQNINEKLSYIESILKTDLPRWDARDSSKFKIDIIRNIYNTLPRSDHHTIGKFFKIISNSNLDIVDPNQKLFKNLTPYEEFETIKLCFSKNQHLDWIKQILPQIMTKDYKYPLIQHILNMPNIENPELKKISFNWIKKVLEQHNSPEKSETLLSFLFKNPNINDKDFKTLCYDWIYKTLKSTDPMNILSFFQIILESPEIQDSNLKKECEAFAESALDNLPQENFYNEPLVEYILNSPCLKTFSNRDFFYNWIKINFSQIPISDTTNQNLLIEVILKNPAINDPDLQKILYEWVKKKLPKIIYSTPLSEFGSESNEYDSLVKTIITHGPNIQDPDLQCICYNWINNNIELMPATSKLELIQAILNMENLEFLETYKTLIRKTFLYKQNAELEAQFHIFPRMIILFLENLKSQNDELKATYSKTLFTKHFWGIFSKENEDSKIELIQYIVKKIEISSPEFRDFFITFYTWLSETLATIQEENQKRIIIQLIKKKPLPQDPVLASILQKIITEN